MSIDGRLQALGEAALLEVDKVADEVLLGKDLNALAERMAHEHSLEVPRFRRALLTPAMAARRGEPGEPGRETALVVRPATKVELWLLVEGFSTLVSLDKSSQLDLGEARLDLENECLAYVYLAEHPKARTANQYFQQCFWDAEERLGRLSRQVEAFNEDLVPALIEELRAARSRAQERQRFMAELKIPRAGENEVGRPSAEEPSADRPQTQAPDLSEDTVS